MKVIDLLNKIANGEEVPDIKWYARILSWDNKNKCFEDFDDDNYCKINFNIEDLNKEVEIIEEDKEIEELDIESIEANYVNNVYNRYDLIEIFGSSINKLRKELNELKKGK